MTLNGRLTSATSKRTLSMQKLSTIPNVTGREMQPCGITTTGPTPENGRDGWRFPIGICSFLKATRLMRLRTAPPSIKTWYNLTLVMVGETSSGNYPMPAILLGQSEASNPIRVPTHLSCDAAFDGGATAAISQGKVWTTCLDVMAQESPNMTGSTLWHLLSLGSELKWP
jgi:hypothetical protein